MSVPIDSLEDEVIEPVRNHLGCPCMTKTFADMSWPEMIECFRRNGQVMTQEEYDAEIAALSDEDCW